MQQTCLLPGPCQTPLTPRGPSQHRRQLPLQGLPVQLAWGIMVHGPLAWATAAAASRRHMATAVMVRPSASQAHSCPFSPCFMQQPRWLPALPSPPQQSTSQAPPGPMQPLFSRQQPVYPAQPAAAPSQEEQLLQQQPCGHLRLTSSSSSSSSGFCNTALLQLQQWGLGQSLGLTLKVQQRAWRALLHPSTPSPISTWKHSCPCNLRSHCHTWSASAVLLKSWTLACYLPRLPPFSDLASPPPPPPAPPAWRQEQQPQQQGLDTEGSAAMTVPVPAAAAGRVQALLHWWEALPFQMYWVAMQRVG